MSWVLHPDELRAHTACTHVTTPSWGPLSHT